LPSTEGEQVRKHDTAEKTNRIDRMSGAHHHHHQHPQLGSRLLLTLLLNLLIAGVEIAGGLLAHSLSLISDALHNLSDAVAVVISLLALRLNRRPRSNDYTFGLKRAQIMAALFNSAVLIVICFYLFREAWERFLHPEPVAGGLMVLVASVGLAANTIATLLLRSGARDNLNIRAAYLHLLSDALSSVGVILGGTAIYLFGVAWVDPLLTVLISLYILRESWLILREALRIVMMAAPSDASLPAIAARLQQVAGVNNIHHAHLWQIDDRQVHFEAHVDITDRPLSETEPLLKEIRTVLKEDFGIEHVTIQLESGSCDNTQLL